MKAAKSQVKSLDRHQYQIGLVRVQDQIPPLREVEQLP